LLLVALNIQSRETLPDFPPPPAAAGVLVRNMVEFRLRGVVNTNFLAETAIARANHLYVASNNLVCIVDVSTSAKRYLQTGGSSQVVSIDLCEEKELLAALNEQGELMLFNTVTGTRLHRTRLRGNPRAVAILESGRDEVRVASLEGYSVQIWQAMINHTVSGLTQIMKHRFSDGAPTILIPSNAHGSEGFILVNDSNICRFYWRDTSGLYANRIFRPKDTSTVAASFDRSNDSQFMTLSSFGNISKWSFNSVNQEVQLVKYTQLPFIQQESIKYGCFCPCASNIAVITSSGSVNVFSIVEEPVLVSVYSAHQDSVRCYFADDHSYLSIFSENRISMWEIESNRCILDDQNGSSSAVSSSAISSDGVQLIVGTESGMLSVWDIHSLSCTSTFFYHKKPITDVAFLNSGNAFVSSSLDGTIRAFDTQRLRNFRVFTTSRSSSFNFVAINETEDLICSSTIDDYQIFVWNFQTAKLLEVLPGHSARISSLYFCANATVVSSSWDNDIRLWNVNGRAEDCQIMTNSQNITALAVSHDQKRLAAATVGQNILFWNIENAQLVGTLSCALDVRYAQQERDPSEHFVCLVYNRDSSLLFGYTSNASTCIYDVHGLVLLRRYPHYSDWGRVTNPRTLTMCKYKDIWAIAGKRAVYVYERESTNIGDVSRNLDEEVSLHGILKAVQHRNLKLALQLAVRIGNDPRTIPAVLYKTSPRSHHHILCDFPDTSVRDLMRACVELVEDSPHCELLLTVIVRLISIKFGNRQKDVNFMMENLQHIGRRQGLLNKITMGNLDTLAFLCCTS
jgi:WD40 repeat protein